MNVDNAIAAGIEAIQGESYDIHALERVKSAVRERLDEQDRVSTIATRTFVNRRRWLRRIGLGAVAASVFCVAVDPFGLLTTKTLYAQAMENLKRGDLYYVMTKVGQREGSRHWIAQDGRRRSASPAGVTVYDKFGNPLLFYTTGESVQKSAMVFKTTPNSAPIQFEESWYKRLEKTKEATLVGEERIANGATAEHYRVESKNSGLIFDVWIDAKSQSIVLVEFEETRPGAPAEALGKYVISGIKSNQDFDPSLFSSVPPKGYEVTVIEDAANR